MDPAETHLVPSPTCGRGQFVALGLLSDTVVPILCDPVIHPIGGLPEALAVACWVLDVLVIVSSKVCPAPVAVIGRGTSDESTEDVAGAGVAMLSNPTCRCAE